MFFDYEWNASECIDEIIVVVIFAISFVFEHLCGCYCYTKSFPLYLMIVEDRVCELG